MKAKIALLLVSTLVTLYSVEAMLGLLDRPADRLEVARARGIEFDSRTPFEVVRDLRAEGTEAFPLLTPAEFLTVGKSAGNNALLPLAGISNVTTVWCNEGGEYLVYAADQHGFNNPPSAWTDEVEVLLLGDSFAQGACCVSGSDVGSQLRLRGYSLLNLGMGGSGPLLSLAVLREYVASPTVVFWLYYEGNDLLNLKTEVQAEILGRYLEEPDFSQGLPRRQAELDAFMKRYFGERFQRHAGSAPAWRKWATTHVKLTHLRSRLSLLRTDVPEETVGVLGSVLEQARDRIARERGELVFVYLPAYTRYVSRDPSLFHRDLVLASVRDLAIPIVDFHDALSASGDPKRFFPLGLAGHYNPQGYRLLAQELDRYLRSD